MKTEKRLVYILNYVNADDSQHFVHVLHLLTRLRELGWSIVILSEKGGVGTQSVLGHEIHYMSNTGGWFRLFRLMRALIALRLKGYRLVFVRISKPAAIVASSLSRLFGWKTLYWLSGTLDDFNSRQPLLKRTREKLTLQFIFLAIHRLVTGPETMLVYYRDVYQVPARKLTLLYNDIDTTSYKPGKRGPDDSRPLSILLLHRLSPVRETNRYMPSIVRALNDYCNASGRKIEFHVVGDGPERKSLEAAASSASDRLTIFFHGTIPNRRVREFYLQTDVFIMPSYREGFPRVILEAMAMGLPIVATDAGGTADLLGPKQREFVASRADPEQFAAKLSMLLINAAKRRELSDENIEYVIRYSTDAVARMYDDVLLGLLSGSATRA